MKVNATLRTEVGSSAANRARREKKLQPSLMEKVSQVLQYY
ncbi:hypothetical protein [Carnobacterium viridans]|nr:hypothetical protein [Carnobacterium viridans]